MIGLFILFWRGKTALRAQQTQSDERVELLKKRERDLLHSFEKRSQELQSISDQLAKAMALSEETEKLSSLGRMAAGVAHEINNPLNFLINIIPDLRKDMDALATIRNMSIEGGGELAKKINTLDQSSDLPAHLGEMEFVFDRMGKALEKSSKIANSLKVFSRSGEEERLSLVTLKDLIQETLDFIPPKVKGQTQIKLEVSENFKCNIYRDEIEQVFVNLIINALDVLEQKGKLRIWAEDKVVEKEKKILLHFQDDGSGISEEIKKQIFTPFFTTKPKGRGTGLGLSIALELVRKSGGDLTLKSQVGEGSTFTITLPS